MKILLFCFALTIRPIAGPIGLAHRYRFFIAIAAWIAFFVVLSFIFFIVRKIIKSRPKPVVYPDEIALKKIDSLNSSYSEKAIDIKQFFSAIVDVLREYIEKRYDIKASTMTTEQFTKKITQIGEISKDNKKFITNLLKRKDSIKFAGKDILTDEIKESSEFIKRFIHNTREER